MRASCQSLKRGWYGTKMFLVFWNLVLWCEEGKRAQVLELCHSTLGSLAALLYAELRSHAQRWGGKGATWMQCRGQDEVVKGQVLKSHLTWTMGAPSRWMDVVLLPEPCDHTQHVVYFSCLIVSLVTLWTTEGRDSIRLAPHCIPCT